MLLIDRVQEAYGGLDRWRTLSSFTAHVSISGAALPPPEHRPPAGMTPVAVQDYLLPTARYTNPTLREFVVEGDTTRPLVRLYSAGDLNRYCVYTPERIEFRDRNDRVLEVLEKPLDSFRSNAEGAPFTPLQRGLIFGAILWEAIVGPFMMCQPSVRCVERGLGDRRGPGERILEVATPSSVDPLVSARTQRFDASHFLERSEYDLETLRLGSVVDAASAHAGFCGIIVPTLRRLSKASDQAGRPSALIDLEIFDVRFCSGADAAF